MSHRRYTITLCLLVFSFTPGCTQFRIKSPLSKEGTPLHIARDVPKLKVKGTRTKTPKPAMVEFKGKDLLVKSPDGDLLEVRVCQNKKSCGNPSRVFLSKWPLAPQKKTYLLGVKNCSQSFMQDGVLCSKEEFFPVKDSDKDSMAFEGATRIQEICVHVMADYDTFLQNFKPKTKAETNLFNLVFNASNFSRTPICTSAALSGSLAQLEKKFLKTIKFLEWPRTGAGSAALISLGDPTLIKALLNHGSTILNQLNPAPLSQASLNNLLKHFKNSSIDELTFETILKSTYIASGLGSKDTGEDNQALILVDNLQKRFEDLRGYLGKSFF